MHWNYYNFLSSHWLAFWRIFRRSPLSEEKYPNRNPAWKQALLIIDFQVFTRKDSSTSLSAKTSENQRFTLVFFLYPFANEARFSEQDGIKNTGRRRRTGFQLSWSVPPLGFF